MSTLDQGTADLDRIYYFEPLTQGESRCMNGDCQNLATHLLVGPDYPGCPPCLRAWLVAAKARDEMQALPRKVKTNDVWPARLIIRIDGETDCEHCGNRIAYYHDQNLSGEWAHTGTERSACIGTERFHIASPKPRCHGCDSCNVTWKQEAWGNAFDCLDCGLHRFYSIGD